MDRYSADDRELFEDAGMALYEELLEAGGVVHGDPRIEPGGDLYLAFSQLRTMGLVRQDQSGGNGSWRTPTWCTPASSPR